MLDIQGSRRVVDVKRKLNEIKDKDFTIEYNLGRNKYEKYRVRIKELYSNVFTVSLVDSDIIKSFSYSDVITSLIHIDLWYCIYFVYVL